MNRICCVCQHIVKESVAIDVGETFNLREGLAFVCGEICKSMTESLEWPFSYSETVSKRQKK